MKLNFRKYPYPYRALLSISNDIDGLDFPTYIKLHRFLNTHDETEVGPGLGLDISDSFWFFSAKPPINDSFTYFDGISTVKSKYADAIQMLVETGHLDTLHTWGNFNQIGGFQRKYAELASNEMMQWKRRPLVWTNHGDNHNFQNLGNGLGDKPFTSDGDGKKQETLEYHTDLFQKLGLTFIWTTKFTSSIWAHDRYLSKLEKGKQTAGIRGKFSVLFLKKSNLLSPLLWNSQLQDKLPAVFFQRYLPNWQSTSTEHLGTIFNPRALDELEKRESATILLTHFGFGPQFPNFSSTSINHLRKLVERHTAGTLGIFSTEHLLVYVFARDHIQAVINQNSIELSWKLPPPKGILQRGLEALHGLTIEIKNAEKYNFYYEGTLVPSKKHKNNILSISTRLPKAFPYQDLISI